MNAFTSHFTSLDTFRLHHLEWAGGAPPVIYLPGFIASAYGALRLAGAISPLRRVLALDLRGRGKSDKPPGSYGMDCHIQDVKDWLDALGIGRCILAGHSFGASAALYFYQAFPQMVEKIILLDGGAPPSEAAFQLFLAYHQHLTYEFPTAEAYLAPYRQSPTMQPWTEEAEMLIRANITIHPDGTASRVVPRHVVESELQSIDAARWAQLPLLYPHVGVPVLLIRAGLGTFGADDRHLTDNILNNMNFPDLRVYDLPPAGHTSILTIPDVGRDDALRAFVGAST